MTLLLSVGGVPITQVTKANRVRDASMIVPRVEIPLDEEVAAGSEVTVLFVIDGRVLRWPMVIEEVLPSSYFLTSVHEPGAGDRREFVRAALQIELDVKRADGESIQLGGLGDVSAAGLSLNCASPLTADEHVEVTLAAASDVRVRCEARVVRVSETNLALEFTGLTTAAENALIDLVFQRREAQLQQRIGVKLT